MALVNLKKIKFVPLLCALVILVSCLPVLPAAAADDYTVSGFWQLNAQPIRVASSFYEDVIFHCAGVEYQKIGIFPGSIYYYTTSDLASGTNVSTLSSAVLTIKADYRLIYFPEPQAVSETFYDWLQDNAEPVAQTFVLDGVWRFDLTIVPSDFYVEQVFTCSNDSVEYSAIYFDGSNLIYDGSSDGFVAWSPETGWASSSYRTVLFQDESSVSEDIWSWLHCNAYQLRDPASDAYPVTSVVFSGTGSSFQFTQDEFLSPDVLLSVTSTGAVLSSGSYRVKTWTYTGEGYFAGLNDDASGQLLSPGNSILLPGLDGEDVSYRFTPAFTTDPVDPDPDPDDQTAVLQAGQWECNSLVMTGEYVDLTSWPDELSSVSLNFSSSGQNFTSISGQYNAAYGDCLYYGNTLAYKYSDLTGTAEGAWQSQSYALLYLESDQEVSQAFYDWFTSNFERVSSDPVLPTYYTTVNIYDSTGLVLLHSIQFSDTNAAPVASLTVSQDGCTISYGDQSTSWNAGDLVFFGFKLSAGSVGPTYKPGLPYMLPGGQTSDVVINLYVADSEGLYEDPSSVVSGFFDVMIWPVMAFFQAEFVPGYSLGKICLFSLLLGLLFWFLAVHKS